ncbi:hypothetical protein HID58_000050, partial [Brassica napus]
GDSEKWCSSLYHYRQLLFPGNGGSDSTDFAGSRLRESGGSDSTVLSPAPLRFDPNFGSIEDDCRCSSKHGSMVFEFYRSSSVLGSKIELGCAFVLISAEAVVLFRWWSDYCGDGVCMPMNGFVTWSRGGGLVTRVPRREDYDTCSLRASRGKEEGVRSMGLGPNRFTVWVALMCLGFLVASVFTFWAWSFGPYPFNKL